MNSCFITVIGTNTGLQSVSYAFLAVTVPTKSVFKWHTFVLNMFCINLFRGSQPYTTFPQAST